jgi:integrase
VSNTSKDHAGRLILGSVSWARRKGYIRTDPLAGRVDLPEPVLRWREARMSEELMDLLFAEAHANKMRSREFGDLIWVLRLTGARPGELRNAEVHNDDSGAKWSLTSLSNKWAWLLKGKKVIAYCAENGIPLSQMKLYNFRHTYINNWIERAGDIYTVAQLCGTSVKMIEKRYGHPEVDRLHERYLAFMSGRAAG